jgi:hypothetical protein
MKKYSVLVVAALLTSACSANEIDQRKDEISLAPTTSQTEISSAAACRDLEFKLVQTSIGFEDTLSWVGTASNKDAIQFFADLNDLSRSSLEIAANNAVATPLRDAVSGLTEVILEAQGLISSEFAAVEVGKLIRPAVNQLFYLCSEWVEVSTSAEELFQADEERLFELVILDNVYADPSVILLEELGFTWDSCSTNLDPIMESGRQIADETGNPDFERVGKWITVGCLDSSGSVFVRRFSSSLDSRNAARFTADNLSDVNDGWVVLFSDQFNVLVLGDEDFTDMARNWQFLGDLGLAEQK